MAFRFWRRIRLAPGVTLNLSKSGPSLSVGPRGAKYTVSARGSRMTAGLPGTGMFYTVHNTRRGRAAPAAPVPARARLGGGFFSRWWARPEERRLLAALKLLETGDEAGALTALAALTDQPDAAWLAGMLALRWKDHAAARDHLRRALAGGDRLGALLAKLGAFPQASFLITPEVATHTPPGEAGTRLALVELAQLAGDRADAIMHLERLLEIAPTDPVVVLSYAEFTLEASADRARCRRVADLTAGFTPETPVETALLLYRGRALARLGLAQAAIDCFTLALRRRKDRAESLLRQLRYERALLYEQVGRRAQARREWESLYGEAPGFADVAARLGLD